MGHLGKFNCMVRYRHFHEPLINQALDFMFLRSISWIKTLACTKYAADMAYITLHTFVRRMYYKDIVIVIVYSCFCDIALHEIKHNVMFPLHVGPQLRGMIA